MLLGLLLLRVVAGQSTAPQQPRHVTSLQAGGPPSRCCTLPRQRNQDRAVGLPAALGLAPCCARLGRLAARPPIVALWAACRYKGGVALLPVTECRLQV